MAYTESENNAFKYSLDSQNKLNEICSSLLECFGIRNFSYMKVFEKNGQLYRLHLCSNKKWLVHSFENHFYKDMELYKYVLQSPKNNGINHMLWTALPSNKMFSLMYDINMWNGITLYQRYENAFEVWGFSSNKFNAHLPEFYVSNLKLLKHFIYYIREDARELISCDNIKNLCVLNDFQFNKFQQLSYHNVNANFGRYLQKTQIKRYYLDDSGLYLTKREYECLLGSIYGKSAKRVAKKLGISPRTVEQYLKSIKTRLNVDSMEDAIEILRKYIS